MTREEFISKIVLAIKEDRVEGVDVIYDIRLQGDEDGDVYFAYEWTHPLMDGIRETGYHYMNLDELMDAVCDDR